MALTLDDKLLGEKAQYYCSSSEDEGEDESDANDNENPRVQEEPSIEPPALEDYKGHCTNVRMNAYSV